MEQISEKDSFAIRIEELLYEYEKQPIFGVYRLRHIVGFFDFLGACDVAYFLRSRLDIQETVRQQKENVLSRIYCLMVLVKNRKVMEKRLLTILDIEYL